MQVGERIKLRPFLFQLPEVFLPLDNGWVAGGRHYPALASSSTATLWLNLLSREEWPRASTAVGNFFLLRDGRRVPCSDLPGSEHQLAQDLVHRRHSVLTPPQAKPQALPVPREEEPVSLVHEPFPVPEGSAAYGRHSNTKLMLEVGGHGGAVFSSAAGPGAVRTRRKMYTKVLTSDAYLELVIFIFTLSFSESK